MLHTFCFTTDRQTGQKRRRRRRKACLSCDYDRTKLPGTCYRKCCRNWMMRSGLQTPGASPFLALLLFFSLLSLVLSWSGRGYGGWSWYGGKNTLEPTTIYADFPRVVENPVDGVRVRSNSGTGKSARPAAVLPSSFEKGSIVSPSQSSTLTRVHAFFIQRLDGSQLLPQFSTRNGPPVETPLTPSQDSLSRGEHTRSGGQSDTWQRVCQVVTDFYAYASSSPAVDVHEPKERPLNVDSTRLSKPPSPDTQTVIASDSQDAAAGRIPERARGSFMAIVVSLVVGIMWF